MRTLGPKTRALFFRVFLFLFPAWLLAAPVPVRHTEGSLRGFLKLSAIDGTPLAAGDLSQNAVHEHITSHLVFRFKDGSVHDETVVYSQQGNFRIQNYHLVQKGPSFHPRSTSRLGVTRPRLQFIPLIRTERSKSSLTRWNSRRTQPTGCC